MEFYLVRKTRKTKVYSELIPIDKSQTAWSVKAEAEDNG
jgi:hypothetical protein